jgi:competence protein ComEC
MLPLLAIFSNLLIVPIIAIIVFLGIFLLIFASFSAFLAQGIGMLIDNVQVLLKSVVKTISNIPFASYETKIPSIIEIVLIMIVVFILFNFKRIYLKKFMIGAGILAVFYLFKSSIEAPRNLEVTFLDVGQGDAHFLHFPNGITMLIDAGVADIYWDNGLNTILPFLKYKGILHLNYLVCSHPHDDHIGGIFTLLNRIRIDTIVVSPYKFNSELYKNLINLCAKKHIPLKYVQRGDQLYPDRSCRVYVLHPNAEFSQSDSYDGSECNNSSLVLKVQYGNIGILFTGDLELAAEQSVLSYKQFLESEIIKVAHHGSNTSTSTEFLTQIQPLVSVISVAKKNKFRHPSEKTLQRLCSYKVKNFLTSKEGAIVFEITPNLIKKITWR